MGRAPCCEKQGLKKGPWAPEEDKLLLDYIQAHGCGNWRSLPKHAGLLRCGKSCRLRWTNYLRPDIKRGAFTAEEEKSIVQLHAIVGNKWSTIAANIQGRTDNEIKNYWNTHLKKRLLRMGIVPDTYTPTPTKPNSSSSSSTTTTTTTRHMAQWESARLEAEARLSQESHLSSSSPSAADKSLPSPTPVDFFLRIWNSPIGDAFRKPVTASTSCATAAMPPPPHTSPLRSSNVTVTTSNEATGEETSEEEEEEEDSYQLYFDFTAGDDLGFFQGQMGSCYSSLLADLSEASLDTAFK